MQTRAASEKKKMDVLFGMLAVDIAIGLTIHLTLENMPPGGAGFLDSYFLWDIPPDGWDTD